MRRRERINVWPSIADLMTVLAVPALYVAVGGLPLPGSAPVPRPGTGIEERAKNREMFRAIQKAEDFVNKVHQASGLELDRDQSLRFGDDLVGFTRSHTKPEWRSADGPTRLRTFCEALARVLDKQPEMQDQFLIFVEGHADPTICDGDPSCNWWFSAERAARFLVEMRGSGACPGSAGWNLLPVGFAAKRPIPGDDAASRRIALRLMPDYKQIIAKFMPEAGRQIRRQPKR
jgi:hypothetical protein